MSLHSEIAHSCTVFGSKMATSSPDGTFAVSNWETGSILWKKTLGDAEIYKGVGLVSGNAIFSQVYWQNRVLAARKDGRVLVFEEESGCVFLALSCELLTS